MKRYLTVPLALALATNSYGKCVYRPHIEAEVQLDSCESVTFGASSSTFLGFAPDTPLYKQGSTLSGTFLAVTVKKSWFDWTDLPDHRTNGFHTWRKGETHSLFVAAPIDSVCPKVIPSTLKVITTDFCCDTLPMREECLVPASVIRVTIVSR
jgi:hypothetical protein